MKKSRKNTKKPRLIDTLAPLEIADYLDSEEMIAEYLSVAAKNPDPAVFLSALKDAAKARGMGKVAKDAGLGRESLYKALSAGAHPRYETVRAVMHAVGVKFVFLPVEGGRG